MILYPVTHQRDFRRDFPSGTLTPTWLDQGKRVLAATTPLLAFHRPLRGPISGILGTARAVMQISELREAIKERDVAKGAQALFHATLSAAAVATAFFNPALSMVLTTVSDMIEHIKQAALNFQARDFKAIAETMLRITVDILFLATILYGAIELTVALMLLQIILDSHDTIGHFKENRWFEGVCQAMCSLLRVKQLVPQAKLLAWKWSNPPKEKGWLHYRCSRGNLMLNVPKRDVETLYAANKESGMKLPYWMNGRWADGHITVATEAELRGKRVPFSAYNKTYNYRIAHVDTVKPFDWAGMSKVQFATVASPDLHQLRQSLGLAPRPIDFHITFGVKR
jgi:hypothetical protein